MELFFNIFIGTILMLSTILIHAFGLYCVSYCRYHSLFSAIHKMRGATVVSVVLGVMLFHTIEIWLWAGVYYGLAIVPDFETALYFSTSSFTTLGYGDVIATKNWRLLSAFEGANGLLLFGWSTAYIFSTLSHITTHEKK